MATVKSSPTHLQCSPEHTDTATAGTSPPRKQGFNVCAVSFQITMHNPRASSLTLTLKLPSALPVLLGAFGATNQPHILLHLHLCQAERDHAGLIWNLHTHKTQLAQKHLPQSFLSHHRCNMTWREDCIHSPLLHAALLSAALGRD